MKPAKKGAILCSHSLITPRVRQSRGSNLRPIWARKLLNRELNDPRTLTAIVDHSNPGTWHGTSVTAPAKTVARKSDADALGGLLGTMRMAGVKPKLLRIPHSDRGIGYSMM